ncbi:Rep family ATP-dependent DNA helicase [Melghirimyces profundicolus]|uniref:DNA 3'-5' helicase n=1 Tax=Melghirimyces profundicolus TaxID=1242148 RepID=A0A2T6B9K0_9BACL|nr:RNA polymerase recycling motor HelD [Melghirimyces profundicolus]PTX52702.1 Rep family ATP-dependent DNA helicase [Melghirimyces profundicolus]
MEEMIQQEQEYLDRTLSVIEDQIREKSAVCKKGAQDAVEEQLLKQNRQALKSLETIRPRPYFGRLDFKDEFGKETIYIGKRGVEQDGDLIVVDWRTDLGKLYNAYQGVKSDFYINNDPNRKVEIESKRAISIENDRVVKVSDIGKTEIVETPSGEKVKMMDSYLEEILRHTGDELQLREIIASIQQEQDEIIRLPLKHTIIVQGAAGSGKSSIALHRISYLLYQYQERLQPEKVLVLAPNEMFLSYIHKLVPELDIDGIEQRTFYDWASTYFTDVREISDLHENYVDIYADEKKEDRIRVSKYKGSLQFKKLLDDLVAEVGRTLLPYKDIHLSEHHTLTKEEIDQFYESRLHLPLNVRLRDVKQFILNWSKKEGKAYKARVEKEFDEAYEKWVMTLPEGEERKNVYEALERAKTLRLKQFSKQVNKAMEEYVRKMEEITAVRMYKNVFQKRVFNRFAPDMDEKLLGLLLKNGQKIKQRQFSYEDIAPLIYLDAKMNGKTLEYEHIVIDEAQDYSPFQLAIMKDYAKSMTILGDVAQGIFSFYGLDSWDEFQSYIQDQHDVKRIDIQTSYRSTKEIMDLANRVLINNSYPYPLVIPVNRSGKEPQVEKVEHFGDLCDRIEQTLYNLLDSGHQTIAILTKDTEAATDLYHQFTRRGIADLELVTAAHHHLQKRVVIIPSYLVKGLEFDAVIIEDVSDKTFQDHTHHAKMLYMSITRAHHELILFYRGNLSPLLEQRDPHEPPRPRASFAEWLQTDYRDPDTLPQVMEERVIEDTETIPLFEDEEEEPTKVERFTDDRERVNDFYAWRTVWKKWAEQQKAEMSR